MRGYTMNRISCLAVVVVLVVLFSYSGHQKAYGYQSDWDPKYYNPNPVTDDFILPLPGGGAMVFRPVIIVQEKITDSKRFMLGNGKYPPKEYPREGSIGGVFAAEGNKRLLYMCKYEVTESQYEAVMKQTKPASFSAKPKADVSWFEAMQFTDELTRWLLKNQKISLPSDEGSPGYVRLPTEEEWEFACRGGEVVDENFFSKDHFIPENGNITDYVQYYRVGDVENLQAIGSTKKPNPLGLFDMLGNAGEMCFSVFRLNYNFGRFGGFVVKGGNLRIPKPEQIRSSFRLEVPFYDSNKADASRNNLTGFRVILTAPLIVSVQRDTVIKNEWDKNSIPSGAELKKSFQDAQKGISYLDEQITDPRIKDELEKAKIGQENMIRRINEIEQQDALSFLRIGSFCADTVRLQLQRLPILEETLQNMKKDPTTKSEMISKAEDNFRKMLQSIDKNLNTYGYAVESLHQKYINSPGLFLAAYNQVIEKQNIEGDTERIQTTELMRSHVEKFLQRDAEAWKRDLIKLNK
ncbi:MAG: SUMF1/EgtB/PvdO family nonheme iron enzyme [Syntrophaceae bacterium]|nr:SUMF1/EgtB/PvdO family nonheme iron enzyme [Syntrophaceae bacterium]